MESEHASESGTGPRPKETLGTSITHLPEDEKEHDIPVDGGLIAWLQVFACWLLFMNTWGLTNSFSIFETYYTNVYPSLSHSSVSLIGSLQLFFTLFVGVFAGRFVDAGYVRKVVTVGMTFEVTGMIATSFCKRYWQVVLAQGVCVGIGSGSLVFTSAVVVPFYFKKRRMLAAGIVSTGSSVAGVVYPLMMRELFAQVGFGWATRTLAACMFGGIVISLAILRIPAHEHERVPVFKTGYFRDTSYTVFITAYAFMVAGVYIPYFYIQQYALTIGIDADMTYNVVSIMNAATFFGRFPYNYLADLYGGIAVLVPCCFATAIVLFLWRFVHTLSGLIVISATFCFVTGGLVSLPAVTIANLVPRTEYGTRIGMGYTIAAIGALLGNPIAGAARGDNMGSSVASPRAAMERWQGVWFIAGAALLIATALMIWAHIARAGFDRKTRI